MKIEIYSEISITLNELYENTASSSPIEFIKVLHIVEKQYLRMGPSKMIPLLSPLFQTGDTYLLYTSLSEVR